MEPSARATAIRIGSLSEDPRAAESTHTVNVMAKKQPKMTVRQFHALGQRVLKATARRKRRGEGVWGLFDELEAKSAAEKNRLQEARHFARLYDREQLDWLCGLGQTEGRPLTRFHVVVLIRVADRGQRNRLAAKCAIESWSVGRLETEVRRIVPRRGMVVAVLPS